LGSSAGELPGLAKQEFAEDQRSVTAWEQASFS